MSEIFMDVSPTTSQAREYLEIFRQLLRLRYRSRNTLPGDFSELKNHLDETYPVVEPRKVSDYGLLYFVGATLSSQPAPLTMGELSRSIDVPLSTATRMVDWLEKAGFAQRLPDSNDRRIVRVELTHAGEAIYRTAHELMCKRLEKALDYLTAPERASLLSLLQKLVAVMEENNERS